MNESQRKALLKALSGHVGAIAADLRAQMLAEGPVRQRAKRLHADEQVGEDFDVWTDLLSRRAAVLWVLKTVYIRVLEDRGLLRPGRLIDPEAQKLFEQLAPNLGETAFLWWVFRDLASSRGGLPELFAPQPAEIAVPDHKLSRALLELWREKDADTSFHWSFAEEEFAGELMGDLYQELDPVVKDRYALCQTPGFVRDFMLGQTLTPAIEELGADAVRLLDPSCGSGHFLLDALRRLVDATAAQHPDWPRRQVVEHALERVVGIDLNDYACALARVRLIMTAAELAGVTSLEEAAAFHPHVYWADGLEQIERDDEPQPGQLDLLGPNKKLPPRAVLTRPHIRAMLRPILKQKFHVVVANPPYITEGDETRRRYHREEIGRRRRYLTAFREYTLAALFVERALQLLLDNGYLGMIIENAFMKWGRGKPLVEDVLSDMDLTLVVDTSRALIPHHGTPTVMIFGRNRAPTLPVVRTVMGKRGEEPAPVDASKGKVWASIIMGTGEPGFENEYISVADVSRERFGSHPWSLGGGGAAELRSTLEYRFQSRLGSISSEIGFLCMTRADEVYFTTSMSAQRLRVPKEQVVENVEGDCIREWGISGARACLFPYDSDLKPVSYDLAPALHKFLWRFRTLLWLRREPNGNHREIGLTWWEWSRFQEERFRSRFLIAFAGVSTHNQFALSRGGRSFNNRSAPVIMLPPAATEDDHFALLALLNSSVACFWMKQVFHPKSNSSQRHHPDPERTTYEFAATGLLAFPVPELGSHRGRLIQLAKIADAVMRARSTVLESSFWENDVVSVPRLRARLAERWINVDQFRQQAIYAQEEIDWICYFVYDLTHTLLADSSGADRLPRGQRAFEQVHGHRSFVREVGEVVPPSEAEMETGGRDLPQGLRSVTDERTLLIRANSAVGMIETYQYKRHWRDTEENIRESVFRERHDFGQLREWLANRLERSMSLMAHSVTLSKLTAAVQDDAALLVIAEVLTGARSFDLSALVVELVSEASVSNHPFHVYTEAGLAKRAAWEETWRLQRLEDEGNQIPMIPVPPEYSQGSRGKSKDFLRDEYWRLRGKLDVPKERFIAFTEVPGRSASKTLYGWAGWTPLERVKAILVMDEECEDQGIALADRIALLDSAWRLIPDVIRDDATTGGRLKAELQALVGSDGPSKALLDDWKKRFPPPGKARGKRKNGKAVKAAKPDDDDEDDDA